MGVFFEGANEGANEGSIEGVMCNISYKMYGFCYIKDTLLHYCMNFRT